MISIGSLVVNDSFWTFAQLFSTSLKESPHGQRKYLGILSNVGIVIDTCGSDVKVVCGETVGWCYVGNVRVVP